MIYDTYTLFTHHPFRPFLPFPPLKLIINPEHQRQTFILANMSPTDHISHQVSLRYVLTPSVDPIGVSAGDRRPHIPHTTSARSRRNGLPNSASASSLAHLLPFSSHCTCTVSASMPTTPPSL